MPIRYLKKHAALEGEVGVEAAEELAQWLRAQKKPAVHLGKVAHVHGAVLQVLLALRPTLSAVPPDSLLTAVLAATAAATDPIDPELSASAR